MLEVFRFHVDPQKTADNRAARVGVFVVYARHVRAAFRNDARNFHELTGLVEQFDIQRALSALHDQSARDHAVENGHVDIAARNKTAYFFARGIGNFSCKHGGEGNGARAFGNDLFFFEQSEDRRRRFVVGDGDNAVNVFSTIFVSQITRSF